ncbi:MAG: DUF4314 domain-containing protein [Ruminococcus flavefaciens]|nr:DUF4314 domain-containing protein [Ruminococcus flavefaciens]MCM1062593.1 DUF4314 domain-containing protein [Eubacterium sp.]
MRFPNEKELAVLREKYPAGTMVRLILMEDKFAPPVGTIGEIQFVDDAGSVHIHWQNGSSLSVIPNVDVVEILTDIGANF